MDAFDRVYTPDRHAGWGPSVWREMFREAAESRELVLRLFARDFWARYRQSLLGVYDSAGRIVGQVGLAVVAGDNHFRAVPHPRQEHQHLRDGCVLSLVEDDNRIV